MRHIDEAIMSIYITCTCRRCGKTRKRNVRYNPLGFEDTKTLEEIAEAIMIETLPMWESPIDCGCDLREQRRIGELEK